MKYKLEECPLNAGWWLLTDLDNNVYVRWKHLHYNETQKFTYANIMQPNTAATIAKEMGDYIVKHHGGKAFPEPHGLEYSENGEKLFLYRNKPPEWKVEIPKGTTKENFAASLKKAAEWLLKKS